MSGVDGIYGYYSKELRSHVGILSQALFHEWNGQVQPGFCVMSLERWLESLCFYAGVSCLGSRSRFLHHEVPWSAVFKDFRVLGLEKCRCNLSCHEFFVRKCWIECSLNMLQE